MHYSDVVTVTTWHNQTYYALHQTMSILTESDTHIAVNADLLCLHYAPASAFTVALFWRNGHSQYLVNVTVYIYM